jgi:hypothetical protein
LLVTPTGLLGRGYLRVPGSDLTFRVGQPVDADETTVARLRELGCEFTTAAADGGNPAPAAPSPIPDAPEGAGGAV